MSEKDERRSALSRIITFILEERMEMSTAQPRHEHGFGFPRSPSGSSNWGAREL